MRALDAGPTGKALVAAGGSLGLILSPLTVWLAAKRRWKVTKAMSWFARVGGCGYALAALVHTLPVFILGTGVALTCVFAMIPLLTQMYDRNYPPAERGRRFSRTTVLRIGTSMAFAWLAGNWLAADMGRWPALLAVYALASFWAGDCLSRCPGGPVPPEAGEHPLRAWRYVKEDPVFRNTLISWMLMGIANLMMLPLRVEYLANPKYGLALTADRIAFLTGVLPNLTRLAMSLVWGRLFDRMNFFVMRAILNVGFALNIVMFFTGDSTASLVMASVVFGIASAGGDIAWNLWTTKLAPPERAAGYMGIHTFLNGILAALAPLIAFRFVEGRSIVELGWWCAGGIVVATLILIPDMRGRSRRKDAAVQAGDLPA